MGPYSSQMPGHLISDAQQWIKEMPTVPIYLMFTCMTLLNFVK